MQCFPQNSATSSTRSEKCIVAALSWPQRERLDRYSGSGHSSSPVLGVRCGAASDLRLHLKQRVLSTDFGRLNHTKPEVRRGDTEAAATRVGLATVVPGTHGVL